MNSIGQQSSNSLIQFGQYVQTLLPHPSEEQKQVLQRLAKQIFYELGVTLGTEVVRELINAYFPAQAGWGGYIADQIFRNVQSIYFWRMLIGGGQISSILANSRGRSVPKEAEPSVLPSFDSREEQMILLCMQRGDHQTLDFDQRSFKDLMESPSALQSFESRLAKLEVIILISSLIPLEKLSDAKSPRLAHFLKDKTAGTVYQPCRDL